MHDQSPSILSKFLSSNQVYKMDLQNIRLLDKNQLRIWEHEEKKKEHFKNKSIHSAKLIKDMYIYLLVRKMVGKWRKTNYVGFVNSLVFFSLLTNILVCVSGAIPMLNQVMSAARGATDTFSGVGRHVNSSVRSCLVWLLCVLSWYVYGCNWQFCISVQFIIFLDVFIVEEAGGKEHWSRHWVWSRFWSWYWSWYDGQYSLCIEFIFLLIDPNLNLAEKTKFMQTRFPIFQKNFIQGNK